MPAICRAASPRDGSTGVQGLSFADVPRGRHHCIDEGPQHLAQTLALGWLWRHGCSPNTHLGSKLHLLLPVSKLLSVELLKRVEQLLLQFLYRLQTL
jgi:hypothetical protein